MLLSFFMHVLQYFIATGPKADLYIKKSIHAVTQRARQLLLEYRLSLPNLCLLIERAENADELQVAFARFNKLMWTISLTASLEEQNGIILKVLKELQFSDKFGLFLKSASNPQQAIFAYKTAVVQELGVRLHEYEEFTRNCKTFEDGLFSLYLPGVSSSTLGVEDTMQARLGGLAQSILSPVRKRQLSAITGGSKEKISETTDGTTVKYKEMDPDIIGIMPSNTRFTDHNITSATKRRRIKR